MSKEPVKIYYNPEIMILVCRNDRIDKWQHPDLAAPFWRIYYNFNSAAHISASGKKYDLTPEKLFLISPDTEYSSWNNAEVEHFYIHFQAKEPFDICPGKIFSWDIDPDSLEIINNIAELLKNDEDDLVRISMFALTLCNKLLLRIPENKLRRGWSDRRVVKVVAHIENNYHKSLTNEMLAKLAGMAPNAFARLFKEQTGMSPQRFLTYKRISQACMLLRFSSTSIDEIAENTGFCDRHYFTRVFTKMRCMTPAAFRKLPH
ncbi:MAG: AraC family transcriptional regulator [Victivallaceae bacterium]